MGDTQLLWLPRLLLGCILHKEKKKVSWLHGNIHLIDLKKKERKKKGICIYETCFSFTKLL